MNAITKLFRTGIIAMLIVLCLCLGANPALSGNSPMGGGNPLADAAAQAQQDYQADRGDDPSTAALDSWSSAPFASQPGRTQGVVFPPLDNLPSITPGAPAQIIPLNPDGTRRLASDATYPGEQLTLQATWSAYMDPTDDDLSFVTELVYPYPYEILLDFMEGDEYITECHEEAEAHKIICTGTFTPPATPQWLEAYIVIMIEATCSLYTTPQSSVNFTGQVQWSDGAPNTDMGFQLPVAPILELTVFPTPTDGAKDIIISQGGLGPLLSWSDYNSGLVCNANPDPETTDIYYEAYLRKQGGSWEDVGDGTNCTRNLLFGPNDITCLEDGTPALYEWEIDAIDVKYEICRDPGVNTFKFTTGTCYPTIEKVTPKFEEYFLTGLSVDNLYHVEVNWLGTAYGDPPVAPFGTVEFELNGNVIQETGQEWGADHTYNMGSDFNASLSGGGNTLEITAINSEGIESDPYTLEPMVFPIPNWITQFALGNFQVDLQAMTVKYARDIEYPDPHFQAQVHVPGWVPYLGGANMGIVETYAKVGAEACSDGSGSVSLSGNTGVELTPNATLSGGVSGVGNVKLGPPSGLDLTDASFALNIGGEIKKEMGIADLVPGLRAAEEWWLVGRIVKWFNSKANVEAAIGPRIDINANFKDENDVLKFDSGGGTGLIDMSLTLTLQVFESLKASLTGGGTPRVVVQVPPAGAWGYLKELAIRLYAKAVLTVWKFEGAWERGVTCSLPAGACVSDEGEDRAASGPTWHLMERDYVGIDYASFIGSTSPLKGDGLEEEVASEAPLVTNVFPLANPALAVRADGQQMVLWVHDDPLKPNAQGEEIYAANWTGSAWITDTLTDDNFQDFAPQVAFDTDGDALAVWERTNTVHISPSLDVTYTNSFEIGWAEWDGVDWSAPANLTGNSLLDTAPELARGGDGALLALWRTSDGYDFMGDVGHPITLTYAVWNGSAWNAPAAAATGLTNIIDVDLAVYSTSQAAIVMAKDADGDPLTGSDTELIYAAWNGAAWSAVMPLTSDAITDTTPTLAFDGSGQPVIVWLRDGALVMQTGWAGSPAPVRPDSTSGAFLDFKLLPDPSGNLALLWQSLTVEGVDVSYAVYDAAHTSWSADHQLTDDDSLEEAISPAFAADGTLYMAYQKVAMEWITQTYQISPTLTITVTHVPEMEQTDLYLLSYDFETDLAIGSEDIAFSVENPAPGTGVIISATVHNLGDFAVTGGVAAFYDGDPGAGGTQIGASQPLDSPFRSGVTDTVSVAWSVPAGANPHTVYVIVDPANAIPEDNEANNQATRGAVLPDLRVDWAHSIHSTDRITLTAAIINAGYSPAIAPFPVIFRAGDPATGTMLGAVSLGNNLAPGEQITIWQALADPYTLAGLGDTFWAVADDTGVVPESNETNNADYGAFGVLPDLTLDASDIQIGETVTVTIHNTGVTTATAVALTVWQDGITGTVLLNGNMGDIAPGGSQTIGLALPEGATSLWVKADPDNLIAESRESNNLAVKHFSPPTYYLYLPVIQRDWPPPTWHFQVVDAPLYIQNVSLRSLAVDSADHLHAAYGGDHLYHAFDNGGGWQYEVVDDSRGVGRWASLALDSDDHPHIAYEDDGNGCLKYGRFDGANWHIETVDCSNGNTGAYVSLVLDAQDRPRIAYHEYATGDIKSARWDGTQWNITIVEVGQTGVNSRLGQFNDIAVDSSGVTHITYNDGGWGGVNPDQLKHAVWDGSQWQMEVLHAGDCCHYNSLAADASGLHLLYQTYSDSNTTVLLYTEYTGGAWQPAETIISNNYFLDNPSLVLDPAGRPHISFTYRIPASNELRYTYKDGSAWQMQTATSGLGVFTEATSLALDDSDNPQILYWDEKQGLLGCTRSNGSIWNTETVGESGDVGYYSSLALDDDGRPHVGYFDAQGGKVKYAAWDGSAWHNTVVEGSTNSGLLALGGNLVLALDSLGSPHISYFFSPASETHYASWTGSAWQISGVERGRNSTASLALDANDRPLITYRADPEGQRYAFWDGAAWQFQTIDPAGSFDNRIVLNSAGRPHIIYNPNYDLRYAWWDGAAWHTETVDSDGTIWMLSLVLDSADRPHISYQDNSSMEIKYAWWDGSQWHKEVVDSTWRGAYPSIALDSADRPHISYYNLDLRSLRYARWNGSAWIIETVAVGQVGEYTSLVLDEYDFPHITYYDRAMKDQLYAWLGR